MQKIKILTYHCALNVGAVLQCYALSAYLKNANVDVEVVDYRDPKVVNEAIEQILHLKKSNPIKYYKRRVIHIIKTAIKFLCGRCNLEDFKQSTPEAFVDFVTRYIPLSSKSYYSKEELASFSSNKSIFLVGSDQVWNPSLSANPSVYFLDFLKEGRKVAYAASFGKTDISKECKSLIVSNLPSFDAISVREKEGVDMVKNLIGKNCLWVIDPVFLLTKKQWERLLLRRTTREPYILVYRMENNELFQREIQKIKKQIPELKVVVFDYISDGVEYDEFVKCKGPLEFISYIYYSNYVVTNSFHGVAFSIIFSKAGIVIPHKTLNNRISSIMSLLNVEMENGVYHLCDMDKSNIEESIRFSKEYLKSTIDKIYCV